MSAIRQVARFGVRSLRFVLNRVVYGALNRFTLWMQNVHYQEMPYINGLLRIRNDGLLEIGRRVHINSGQYYNPIGGDAICYVVVRPGAHVRIGDDCGISNATLHAFTGIELEEGVSLGGGCRIYDSDFHPLDAALRMSADALAYTASKPVRIERGAWIGGHSIVLKGVTIGRNAVVAAGSIVTKSIPPSEIWGGNPATFLRKLDGSPKEGDRIPPESGSGIAST